MAEYIERDALYDELKNAGGCDAAPSTWDAGWDDAITEAIRLLENSPVADVAPVVRCRECKHRGDYDNCPAANSSNYDMKDWDFCSYGEREEKL